MTSKSKRQSRDNQKKKKKNDVNSWKTGGSGLRPKGSQSFPLPHLVVLDDNMKELGLFSKEWRRLVVKGSLSLYILMEGKEEASDAILKSKI